MYEVLYKVITPRGWYWSNEYFSWESNAQEFADTCFCAIVRKVKVL